MPVLRWPGGCFADEYHWREGIGPRDQRPRKVNTHWGGVVEDNSFGTHEFMDFAELIGADAYVNGNVGTGTPQEMAEWLEYMTSDTDSTLAQLRRKNGRDKPWKVKYFAVGNETWGCGGNMRPEYYADLYRHYVTFMKAPRRQQAAAHRQRRQRQRPALDRSADARSRASTWTRSACTTTRCPRGKWDVQRRGHEVHRRRMVGDARAHAAHGLRSSPSTRKIMDKYDPEKRVGLYVDEWGTWYDVEPGTNPGFLYQQNTLRDALVAAVNLNIFHAPRRSRAHDQHRADGQRAAGHDPHRQGEDAADADLSRVPHVQAVSRRDAFAGGDLDAPSASSMRAVLRRARLGRARSGRQAAHRARESRSARAPSRSTLKVPGAMPTRLQRADPHRRRAWTRTTPSTQPRGREARGVQRRASTAGRSMQVDVPAKSIIVLSETGKSNLRIPHEAEAWHRRRVQAAPRRDLARARAAAARSGHLRLLDLPRRRRHASVRGAQAAATATNATCCRDIPSCGAGGCTCRT